MAAKNLTRKQREFLQHRKEIMETALALFSQKGFANVSIQEIALKSEFAVGTIYKFFPTKDDLYQEVMKEKFFELYDILSEALDVAGTEIDKMKSFLETKINWFSKNMDYVRLYVTETFGVGFIDKEELDQIKETIHTDLINKIRNLFKSGIKKKRFMKMDPGILAISLNGLSNGILFEMIENRNAQNLELNTVLKIFLQPFCLENTDEVA